MDNEKIGKLIARLRKQQNLTQQELGDKVGVGFRAVSNWERGNTLPDIANMNELIKIFGITLDELMAGKLNDKENTKNQSSKKSKTIIPIILALVVLLTLIIVIITHYNNKTYVYKLSSMNEYDYTIEGQITFHKDDISIMINKIRLNDKNLNSTTISDYEYKIMTNNAMLFGYRQGPDNIFTPTNTIEAIINNLRINYNTNSFVKRKTFLEHNVSIEFTFKTNDGQTIEKNIELDVVKQSTK